MRNKLKPILEGLRIMVLELFTPALHFKQEPRLPDQVRELRSLAFFFDSEFQSRSCLFVSLVPESLKKPVTEDLSFSLFVASQSAYVADKPPNWLCCRVHFY